MQPMPGHAIMPMDPDEGIHLEKYWGLIKPKIHLIIILALVFAAGAYVRVSMKTEMYMAGGMLMIEPEANVINISGAYRMMDFRNEYFNTQINILQSPSLQRQVFAEVFGDSDPKTAVGGQFMIMPIEETRLVSINCVSPDGPTAARLVNTLFDRFVEFNLGVKTQAERQATEFITRQISELRRNLSQKETELQDYGKRKELFYLSGRESTVVEKFSDLNKAFTQAQIERINRESSYNQLRGLKYEEYPVVQQNQVVNGLKSTFSNLESDYQRKSQVFKEDYPEMVQLRSQMESISTRIEKESRELAEKELTDARSLYQTAQEKERSLRNLLDEQKRTVTSSNTDAIYYKSLEIEVQNMRLLLDHLIKREKEALVSSRLEGLQTSNIKIIDRAEVPGFPMSRGRAKATMMGLFLGAAFGLGLIFLLDFLDRTLRTPEDVKTYLKLPTLGMVPSSKSKSREVAQYYHYSQKKKDPDKAVREIELINFVDPECPFSEQYRTIRTAILLSTAKTSPRVISFSSAIPSEGKTVTSANVAISFSQLGKKVLIIDGDLRKPRVHKIFEIKNTIGLSSFLVGRAELSSIVFKTHIPNLFAIPSGPIPPNPAELIDSEMMTSTLETLLKKVDYIIIDTPPLIGIVDPILLGKLSDAMVLVTWAGKTNRTLVEKAKEEVERYGIRLLGMVLNRIDSKGDVTSYGYSYRYRYAYKEEDTDVPALKKGKA
jgi:capsular exopolysaccharide synthesis family protein